MLWLLIRIVKQTNKVNIIDYKTPTCMYMMVLTYNDKDVIVKSNRDVDVTDGLNLSKMLEATLSRWD